MLPEPELAASGSAMDAFDFGSVWEDAFHSSHRGHAVQVHWQAHAEDDHEEEENHKGEGAPSGGGVTSDASSAENRPRRLEDTTRGMTSVPLARFLWREEDEDEDESVVGGETRLGRMQARSITLSTVSGLLLVATAASALAGRVVWLHVSEACLMGWSVLCLGLVPTQVFAWRALGDIGVAVLARRYRFVLDSGTHMASTNRVAPV